LKRRLSVVGYTVFLMTATVRNDTDAAFAAVGETLTAVGQFQSIEF
jgi:hypothetical protein